MASLPLLPEFERQELVGIAGLAKKSTQMRAGHEVEYRTLAVRSILNRCDAPQLPFAWTINPYRGCEFACKYCYARYTHEFMELRNGRDFERHIFVKQESAWLLRRELRQVRPGEEIAIGTATDPYQPTERRYGMTRALLEELAKHRGLSIGLVTKSQLVARDIDLFRSIAEHNFICVRLTVTTTDVELARKLEPRAPRPDLRLEAVKRLTQAGVNAGVLCAPVLPGITDIPGSLEKLIIATKLAKARFFVANPLFMKPCSAAVFLPFLEQNFPALVEDYRRRYSATAFVSAEYRRNLQSAVDRLCRKHGLPSRDERQQVRAFILQKIAPENDQMRLF